MHGAALRILMDEDQRKVVAEYGYRRSVAYCEKAETDSEKEDRAAVWNNAETHGKREVEILDGIEMFLNEKKKRFPELHNMKHPTEDL